MKRKNKINRMAAFLAAVLLAVFGLCQAAFAADANAGRKANIDPQEPVSLSITLKDGDKIAEDKTVTIELYQVGEWDSSQGNYVLTEEFAPSNVNLGEDKGQEITEEINALKQCGRDRGLTPVDRKTTENGRCTFTGLTMGLYMVCENLEEETQENVPEIASYLISLPLWEEDENGGRWNYAVEAVSKVANNAGTVPNPPGDGTNGGGNSGNGGGGGSSSGGGGGRSTSTITPDGVPTAQIDDEGTPLDNLDPPLENIEDEDVPLNPFTQLIEDVLVPLGLLPKTGDGSVNYLPLLAMMAASGLLIIGLIWRRVRKAR